MKQFRLLTLLALLMTAVTGAWAQTSDKETPLTLQATADGWISISDPKVGMKYKVGNDEKQTITGTDYVEIPVTEGQTVQFFGLRTAIEAYGVEAYADDPGTSFGSSVPCYIYGNIMSLVDELDFATATVLSRPNAFRGLFYDFSNLLNHPTRKLVLPATTLTKSCYNCMFEFCTSLTTAPELPAPTLAEYCYRGMFSCCSSLNAVTCLATDISAQGATDYWLGGVAATGTLTIAKGMKDKWAAKSTDEGIPSGWTTDVYGYKVKLADRTADAANWTATVGTSTTAEPLPVAGLNEGDAVTLKYNGHLKVKNVTATTDAVQTYLMWDATKKKLVEADIPATAKKVENADDDVIWEAGTYLVEGNVTINGEVTLSDDVELIIKDGAKLTANHIFGDKHNLNIYGQADKSGELNVACSGSDAIKRFNLLNIHSCKVNASSLFVTCGGFCDIGEFNLYGGSVDAKYTSVSSGYGLYDISSLNIWGGEMKAEGKGTTEYSYGISCLNSVTNVTVYGGKLWVKADTNALDPTYKVTFTKDPSYDGKIETSNDGEYWDEYTDEGKPDTKYVRVGY